jgi:hypothetical protein
MEFMKASFEPINCGSGRSVKGGWRVNDMKTLRFSRTFQPHAYSRKASIRLSIATKSTTAAYQ